MRSAFVASLAVVSVALIVSLESPAHAGFSDPSYVGCYVLTPGGDHTAISLPPHLTTAIEVQSLQVQAKVEANIGKPNGYTTSDCRNDDTAEKIEEWYRKTGYTFVKRAEWPKGTWPDEQTPSKKIATPVAKPAKSGDGYLVVEDKKPTTKTATPRVIAKATPKAKPVTSIDRGSNKSKCHREGKKFVCPASKQ